MSKALSSWLGLSLCILGYFCATNNPASAQVTSDGTVNTQVTENGNTAEITGGERAGDNLFHSFQDFSVETGNEASFLNANDISNIFSRVTGGNISNIDGLISANGSANLFLINPAGIIFGEGARLDIGGSFYGSSASSILFEDGEFSATDLDNPPLLTINAPIGLGFRDQPGDIVNNSVANDGNGLEVDTGKNITLLGGDINFDGGRIFAPGGIVNLGGLTAAGTVSFADDGSLSFAEGVTRGNISLANSSGVGVLAGGGGSIFVNARNLDLTSGSRIQAGIDENLGSVDAQAGNIVINATESVTVDGTSADGNSSSGILNQIQLGAAGNGGALNITTPNLSLTNGGAISTSTGGQGDGGPLNIDATESVTLDGLGVIASAVGPLAVGNGGALNITTPNLALTNGGSILTSTLGKGNTGSILIDAKNISAAGNEEQESGVFSTVENGATGNSNEIKITTNSLSLTNGGEISASTFGEGDGGTIDINATESVTLDAGDIFNTVQENATGNSGELNITTPSLTLTNGGQINASTFGQGNAGNITIDATDISFDGVGSDGFESRAVNNVEEGAVGQGGKLKITTANLSLTNGGAISASTAGQGDGGSINIDATKSVTLDGSSAIANLVAPGAVGNGGALNITTPNLALTNRSGILASTLGDGDGGSISINATDVVLTNGSLIDASNFNLNSGDFGINTNNVTLSGSGNGGSVFVKADTLSLDNGQISATNFAAESPSTNATPKVGGNITLEIAKSLSLDNDSNIGALAAGNANGGNVDINANFIVAFPDGDNNIGAAALQGRGGNINIASEGIFGIEERPLNDFTNDISASSEVSGFDGTVNINTSDINPVQGVTELPSNVVEPEQTTAQACEAGRGTANNGLAIAGKGGVTPTPDAPLNSENIISPEQNPAAFAIPEPIETSQGKIQPARGITVTKSGHIVLTAYRTNNAGERIPESQINCGQR